MNIVSHQRSGVSKSVFRVTLCALPFALSLVGAMLFALCVSAQAQQPKKVPRIGYLGNTISTSATDVKAFRERLRELGLHRRAEHYNRVPVL